MSNDPVLNMYETQAELAEMKEEIKEIQKQNNELNQMTFNNLMKIGERLKDIPRLIINF